MCADQPAGGCGGGADLPVDHRERVERDRVWGGELGHLSLAGAMVRGGGSGRRGLRRWPYPRGMDVRVVTVS